MSKSMFNLLSWKLFAEEKPNLRYPLIQERRYKRGYEEEIEFCTFVSSKDNKRLTLVSRTYRHSDINPDKEKFFEQCKSFFKEDCEMVKKKYKFNQFNSIINEKS